MIKSFIYLDEQKMYSLSSQIFEGITEYVLSENSTEENNSTNQAGPLGSGRMLADAMRVSDKSTEKKFLHDYSFTLFERHLDEKELILNLAGKGLQLEEVKAKIGNFSFIKIKAKAVFNDTNKITDLFSEVNDLGEAIANVTAHEAQKELRQQIEEGKGQIKNKQQQRQMDAELKQLTNRKNLAKQSGLYQDPTFMKDLTLLTKFGFSDMFEIQQHTGELSFTSCLNRDFLRENEDILIRKYARKTEKEVVVFGVISQAFLPYDIEKSNGRGTQNMKAVMMNIVDGLCEMESAISGKQDNEIVIDPIAAYIEL